MKKVLKIISLLTVLLSFRVFALDYCKISINIIGEGTVSIANTNDEYITNSQISLDCSKELIFFVRPNDGYKLENVKNSNEILTGEYTNEGMQFIVNQISNNMSIIITFKDRGVTKTISDGNVDLDYYQDKNKIVYATKATSAELVLPAIKEYINEKTILEISLDGVKITLPSSVLNKYKNDSIQINAHEISSDVISVDQANAVKNGIFYDFAFFVQNEKITELDSEWTIKLPYIASSGYEPKVYAIATDAAIQELESAYENNVIEFKTKSVSLISVKLEEIPGEFVKSGEYYMDKLEKVDETLDYLSSLDYNVIFTVVLGVGFVIYMIKDYLKNRK